MFDVDGVWYYYRDGLTFLGGSAEGSKGTCQWAHHVGSSTSTGVSVLVGGLSCLGISQVIIPSHP